MLDKNKYAEFLELPEDKRCEYLTGAKLYPWQKLYIKFVNKWWEFWRKANPHLRAIDLCESIYKGRF